MLGRDVMQCTLDVIYDGRKIDAKLLQFNVTNRNVRLGNYNNSNYIITRYHIKAL